MTLATILKQLYDKTKLIMLKNLPKILPGIPILNLVRSYITCQLELTLGN